MSPRKQPKSKQGSLPVPTGKHPRADASALRRHLDHDGYVVFSFRHSDHQHDQSWSWPGPDHAKEILDFACETNRRTWGEVLQDTTGGRERHKKHHDQPISTLCREAQDRLAELHLDEVLDDDKLFRFRLSGEKRLWGFRRGDGFYVLWWDAEHRVYPTGR